MCWACSPTCGGCRPPSVRSALCDACGAFNLCDMGEAAAGYACDACGADITAAALPPAVRCVLCGRPCYNPCAKGRGAYPGAASSDEGLIDECSYRVREPLHPLQAPVD
ncbi:MAG: hypothetical protein HFJ75_05845 [Eggerthellaceae bacterium]|nr:hypothetical protein [Eggerthellaceae bacterium]